MTFKKKENCRKLHWPWWSLHKLHVRCVLGDGNAGVEADLPVHDGPGHAQPHCTGHAPILWLGHAASQAGQLERLEARLLQVNHAPSLCHRALDSNKHLRQDSVIVIIRNVDGYWLIFYLYVFIQWPCFLCRDKLLEFLMVTRVDIVIQVLTKQLNLD